jgi:hypothetical protein
LNEFTGLLAELQRHLALQWIDDETQPETEPPDARSVNAVDFVIPPPEELTALYAAAQGGFMSEVQQEANRLKQLAPEYITFANQVLELSQQFNDEAILDLLGARIE